MEASSDRKGRSRGRVRLTVPCEIKGVKGKATTRDINLDGCVVSSPQAFAEGDTLELTLRFASRLEIKAEVRWAKPDAKTDHHSLGCRFVHTDASQQSLKEALTKMASAIDSAGRGVK